MATKQKTARPPKKAERSGSTEGASHLTSRLPERIRSVRSAEGQKLTHFITPMLASLHDQPFDDPDWIFEIKWDGYRAIAETGSEVRLYSRNGLSFLRLYPEIAQAIARIKEPMILDGEIVVLNEKQKPDFQKLQQYGDNRSLTILYYVFDCLSYNGQSLMNRPLIERKQILRKILPKSQSIVYADHVERQGKEFFSNAVKMDLEGVIAKRASSLYHPGKRTREWLKIKNHNIQEAIIAGYTAPRKSRQYFGALILGVMEKGNLKYIGHTGTGFTQELLKKLYMQMQPLKRPVSPFDKKIPVNGAVTWIEPELVCNIKYTEMTADGILRHPVFMGLRIDKGADETTLEKKPSHTPSAHTKGANNSEKRIVKAGNHTITITHERKVYWPEEQITKGDVIDYYNTIHKFILPYLKDRPESLRRTPNGVRDEGFFQKDAGGSAPEWVETVDLYAGSAERNINYILCNNLATLLYLNNLGCIELNPWNSRVKKPDHPDYMVLDIDPSEKNSFGEVIETALAIKSVLDKAGAQAYCKTSGATGLHIYVPLNARYTYDQVRHFAEIIARLTEEQLPRLTTTERALTKRRGRIYIDYLQNKVGQTLASVYSVRPKPGATVSIPLDWKEVKEGLHPSQFTLRNVPARLEKKGDLFQGVLTGKTDLRKCLNRLGS